MPRIQKVLGKSLIWDSKNGEGAISNGNTGKKTFDTAKKEQMAAYDNITK